MHFGETDKNSSTDLIQKATIGASVSIKGEISGDEDILIEGAVEGTINLKQNMVMVAKTGKVKANINGVIINVEGEVIGDLSATEQIVVHKSGRVRGNLSAPRISVEDGARVRGQINTDFDSDNSTDRAAEFTRPTASRVEVFSSAKTTDEPVVNGVTSKSGKAIDLTKPSSLI